MKCAKCGEELVAGAIFCQGCGAKAEENVYQDSVSFCPECGGKLEGNVGFCPHCGYMIGAQATENPVTGTKMWKRKTVKSVFAVMIVGLLVVCAVRLIKNQPSEKELVYYKDFEAYYMKNMDKADSQRLIYEAPGYIDSVQTIDKYVYIQSDGDRGDDLIRIRKDKIKKDYFKTKKKIEEIAYDINSYETIGTDVIYWTQENELYHFRKGDSERIDKMVQDFRIVEDKKIVLYTAANDLYVYDVDKQKSEKICKNVSEIKQVFQDSLIVCKSGNISEAFECVMVDFKGKETTIDNEIFEVLDCYEGETPNLLYLKQRTLKESADEIIDMSEFENLNSYDDILKTYCAPITKEQAVKLFFTQNGYAQYWHDTPQECLEANAEWMLEDIVLQIEAYDSQGEESGYCICDTTTENWYFLEPQDYDKNYNELIDLNQMLSLKSEITNQSIENTYRDLYYWSGKGQPECIQENVVDYCNYNKSDDQLLILSSFLTKKNSTKKNSTKKGIFTYTAFQPIEITLTLKELEEANGSLQAAYNNKWLESNKQMTFLLENGKELKNIPINLKHSDGEIADIDVNDKEYVLTFADEEDREDKELVLYKEQNGELQQKEVLEKGIKYADWLDNKLYFRKYRKNGEKSTISYYANGKVKEVVEDVEGIVLISKDVFLTYNVNGELIIYDNKGQKTEIDDDVWNLPLYLGQKRVLYLKDEDLYLYRGKKENQRIDKNVEFYFCENTEDEEWLFWN